jgi:4-hydroxy-tetrahydrodipicolinate synthase
MCDSGVHGMIMLGTVGENCSLDAAEKLDVLRCAIDAIGKRVPVLTGVAECSTAQAVRFVAEAEKLGCGGLMLLPAMVYKADAREVVAHFRAVARSTSLPIMIYNNPVSYGIDIRNDSLEQLASQSNIVAIKESSDDPRRITDIINTFGDRFAIFSGVDDLALESMMLGAIGWVSGLVNAFPRENRLLWELAQAGKWNEARQVYRWYMPLLHLDTHVKLVQYIKLAVQECGYGSETVRMPRMRIEGAEREQVLAVIRKAIASRPKGTGA